MISAEENILCNVLAITFDNSNSFLVIGVTNNVDIVDSLFSKYIIEPTYISAITVASIRITIGRIAPNKSSPIKNKIILQSIATPKLTVVRLYLCKRVNSPFIRSINLFIS